MTQSNMPNLPGFEAMADTFAYVQNMWGGAGVSGMTPPSSSLDEINKQIADLKTVASWLDVNMTMLRGTIQALEVQSAAITALHAMATNTDGKTQQDPASTSAEQSGAQAAPVDTDAQVAAAAWWSALQTQFNQAVSSAMASETSGKSAAPEKASASTANKATKKSAKKSDPTASVSKTSAKPRAKAAVKKRSSSIQS